MDFRTIKWSVHAGLNVNNAVSQSTVTILISRADLNDELYNNAKRLGSGVPGHNPVQWGSENQTPKIRIYPKNQRSSCSVC